MKRKLFSLTKQTIISYLYALKKYTNFLYRYIDIQKHNLLKLTDKKRGFLYDQNKNITNKFIFNINVTN